MATDVLMKKGKKRSGPKGEPKILLLGPTGQVGWELQRSLAPLGRVISLGRTSEDGLCGDLTRLDALAETVRRLEPEVIVNAAAYTAVDRAESEPLLAAEINAKAVGVLAREAGRIGAWLIHYSTDYIFDGSGDRPWKEDDAPCPLNVYGETKLEGEHAIRESGCRHLVFRTSWIYSARGTNFVRTILRLAGERDALQVIEDQVGAPTGADLVANVTAQCLSMALRDDALSGTYHLAASGETSWHQYARFIIAHARRAGWPLRVSDERIEPVASEAFPTAARRPRNSRLDCNRLKQTFGLNMPDWRDGVKRVLSEIHVNEKELR